MAEEPEKSAALLGKSVPPVTGYAPELLDPIPRALSRQAQGLEVVPEGCDLWHAYELSWLQHDGKPIARVGRFWIPASTPNMVESKSFKLYLNSLNNECFEDETAAVNTIVDDISAVVGARVHLELLEVEDPRLAGAILEGDCLDSLQVAVGDEDPSEDILSVEEAASVVEEKLYTHLLRSLCPVTGQPDWATVWLHYQGAALDRGALLRYFLAFRNHHEYHEQCVERMFHDIGQSCHPEFLHIQGFYTRRGGMDINPFRSTDAAAEPLPRLNRQ